MPTPTLRTATSTPRDGSEAGAAGTWTSRIPVKIGRWRIDQTAREIEDGASRRRLSPRAMGVLAMLAEAEGAVVSRPCLMDAVWPDVHVGEESLTQAVAELRRAFGDRRGGAQTIETVPKMGYRLLEPVTFAAPSSAPAITASVAGAVTDGIELPLEAHLAVLEARALERQHGYLASGHIRALLEAAAAAAPLSACVQAEYAILVGCTVLHKGDRTERLLSALEAAERSLALRPGFVKARRARGFVAGALGDWHTCKASFEAAFALDQEDAETYTLAAQAFFGLGAPKTALVLAERATALDAEDFLPPYLAARAALLVGDRSRAVAAARVCVSRAELRLMMTPRLDRAATVRGAALAMLGYGEAALEALSDGDPGPEAPHFCRLVALAEAGEIAPALDTLERLVSEGWHGAGWLLSDPVHQRLSGEPRYQRLAHHFGMA